MSRDKYRILFRNVYMACLIVSVVACIGYAYFEYENCIMYEVCGSQYEEHGLSWYGKEGLSWALFSTWKQPNMVLGLLFLFPAVATWVITGMVRLTSRIEPYSEEELQLSFVERKSGLQLYTWLSVLLLLPYTPYSLGHLFTEYFEPIWVCYAFALIHILGSCLMVLLLRSAIRFEKSFLKITVAMLFLLAACFYQVGIYTFFKHYGQPETYRMELGFEPSDFYSNDKTYADFESTNIETTATDMAQQLLEYTKSGANQFLLKIKKLVPYNPDMTIDDILASDASVPESLKQSEESKDELLKAAKKLSRYYQWIFTMKADKEFNTILDVFKKELSRNTQLFNYKDYEMYVNILDVAYKDLNGDWEDAEDPNSKFYSIYNYAKTQPLTWEGADSHFYISHPYIRYKVENNKKAQKIMLWAYTFWGRRYNEETLWRFHEVLDEVLKVYPNTLFPEEEILHQNEQMYDAREMLCDFLNWYRINSKEYRKLKVAQYDNNQVIKTIDPTEMHKYIDALEKGNFMSHSLISKLREKYTTPGGIPGTIFANLTHESAGWLNEDPLLDTNLLPEAVTIADCNVEEIIKPSETMRLSVFSNLWYIYMEYTDGAWRVTHIEIGPGKESREREIYQK